MENIYEGLNVHARHERILNILNSMQLQGYTNLNTNAPLLVTAMKELAALDQDMTTAEKAAKAAEGEAKGGSGDA